MSQEKPRRQPYSWLGAGALTLGVGALLAGGTAIAHADTGGSGSSDASGRGSRTSSAGQPASAASRVGTSSPATPARGASATASGITAGLGSWQQSNFVSLFVSLRVDGDDEREGLDIALHGEALHQ